MKYNYNITTFLGSAMVMIGAPIQKLSIAKLNTAAC